LELGAEPPVDQPITLAQEEIFTAYHECAKPLSDNGREN